ncbi:MAG: hypothetical protein IKV53_01830 [Clostridia bacterium]|nr:hypothetical protein [Clostridia bacterium]
MSRIIDRLLSLVTFGREESAAVEEDGGVVRFNEGLDAPKTIKSTDIVSFAFEISFVATVFDDKSELEGRIYKMSASLEGGRVKARLEWRDRFGSREKSEYETDGSFMERLQRIISDYNLAQHNGCNHCVSGLPDMYGELLDVKYASGEAIYAYNNQEGFLSMDAITEFIHTFCASNKDPFGRG